VDRTESSQDTLLAPSVSSAGTSASTSSSQKEKSGGSFSSLFHHHRGKDDPREHHTLSALMAPAVNVAGAHNPFIIGGMREDGSRTRPSMGVTRSDKESVASEDTGSGSSSPRHSRRHRIKSAFGRSLSPWRFHSDSEKNAEKKRGGGAFNFSRLSCRDSLDVEREKKADSESDGESVKSGLAPRNSAFGADYDSEDSEEDDEESYVDVKKQDAALRNERKAKEEKGEAAGVGSHEDEDRDDDSGEESDDYIDFDEKTLDNTLFNAGCTDLHDAWLQNDGPHSHHARTPDEIKTEDLNPRDDYYGPNDFDAAWEGAGPSGHDEEDEALRAPNVVIGQFNNVLSPSKLVGEGVDVILAQDEDKSIRSKSPHSSYRSKSPRSSSSSKVAGSMSSGQSGRSSSVSDSKREEKKDAEIKARQLTASRPIFERNRCTITLIHGDYETLSKESKKPKRYIVASDGSAESSYAIEWTIGTVLRDGDEMLIVSVMETDAKLDATDSKHEDKTTRQEHQRIRQSMAVVLARRALAVLQRTRLSVKVVCQALHARHSRHFLLEMIDFYEPTMCVVGSRGLNSLKGVLLGSFSNYCVQKSPVPVMVVRKRLKLPALPRGRSDVVSNVRRKHISLDQAIIEKDANVAETPEGEDDGEKPRDEVEEAKANNEQSGEQSGEEGKGDDVNSTISEAEKIKEEAIAKNDDMMSQREEAQPSSASEGEYIRGRATFTMGDDEEDQRGRSRSRTSEK
jgi:nucleotide-binding universal stress UspA family protein